MRIVTEDTKLIHTYTYVHIYIYMYVYVQKIQYDKNKTQKKIKSVQWL